MNTINFAPTDMGTSVSSNANEKARFRTILTRLFSEQGEKRVALRKVVVEYLMFSPISDSLISELITNSIKHSRPDRLDVPIDVLGQLGDVIYDYAYQFLVDDIKSWSHLHGDRAYEPNDDYWYILLRSVARSSVETQKRIRYANMCAGATSRGVLEGVVEALGDIDTEDAYAMLKSQFFTHDDAFIADLAREVYEGR